MNRRVRLHFMIIGLGLLATMGVQEAARGVILPRFMADLGLESAVGAAIFSAGGIGFLISSGLFGWLSGRIGLKLTNSLGALIVGLAVMTMVTAAHPWLLFGAFACMGAGLGMMELSASLPISILYGEKQGGPLNLLHGFYGIGALLGPVWVTLWLDLGTGWRAPLGMVGGLFAVWAIYYALMPSAQPPVPKEEQNDGSLAPLLRDPLVWAAALGLGAAVAAEVGLTLWLPTYLFKVKGISEASAALYTSLFFAGFTFTRLAGIYLVERLGYVRSVGGLALVGLAGLGALIALPGEWAWLTVLAGAGVGSGFPTCMALVSLRHPARVNQAFSVMYFAGGLAGMLTGPFMGFMADRGGFGGIMGTPVVAFSVLLCCMMLYLRTERKHASAAAEA